MPVTPATASFSGTRHNNANLGKNERHTDFVESRQEKQSSLIECLRKAGHSFPPVRQVSVKLLPLQFQAKIHR